MDRQYKVIKVSPKVDNWESKFGPMVTHYVQLDGFDGPVQLNQKPTSPKPEEGQELFGHVESNQHGHKFKKAQNPNYSGGNRATQRHEKNEDGMAWGNALNVAVLALHYGVAAEDLIDTAKEIFNARPGVVQTNISIDNGAGRAAFAEGLAKMAADTQKANTKDDDPGPSDADYQGDDDGEIDLDDIPF